MLDSLFDDCPLNAVDIKGESDDVTEYRARIPLKVLITNKNCLYVINDLAKNVRMIGLHVLRLDDHPLLPPLGKFFIRIVRRDFKATLTSK